MNNYTVDSHSALAWDYRDYGAQYWDLLDDFVNNNGRMPNTSEIGNIEADLIKYDSVVIERNNPVGSGGAGLFVTLDNSGFSGFQGYLGSGASLERDGENTGRKSGTLLSVTDYTLTFSEPANTDPNLPGDSGGAYLIIAGGREYIAGTQSAGNSSIAIGTRLNYWEWTELSNLVVGHLSGDITGSEPVNMAIGTTEGDILVGSARPDFLLGRDGADEIDGGDTVIMGSADLSSAQAGQIWADDQLYGGAGNDTFVAGMGQDLIHGGDLVATGATVTAISEDGVDTIDYSNLSVEDEDKGFTIYLRDSAAAPSNFKTYSSVTDFNRAVFVEDMGRDKTIDTLISMEKVTTTSADDTLRIDELDVDKIATTSGQGGLLEVDMGYQIGTAEDEEGDKIDMSRSEDGAKITWATMSMDIQEAGAGSNDPKLTVKNVETLIASKADDEINISASFVTVKGQEGEDNITNIGLFNNIHGGSGNDTIDSTLGWSNLYWAKGDGLDTVTTNYQDMNLTTLQYSTYEGHLQNINDPWGVETVNFTDLAMADAEFVISSLSHVSTDVSDPDHPEYMYTGQVSILEKSTGDGINLGTWIINSSHDAIGASHDHVHIARRPTINFSDGALEINEGWFTDVSFRIASSSFA